MESNIISIAIGERWLNRKGALMRVCNSDVHGYWVVSEDNPNNGYAVNVHGAYLDNDSGAAHVLDLVSFVGIQGALTLQGSIMTEEDDLPLHFVDMRVPGYERLANVLQRAYDQASKGKGKDRHAKADVPFERQPMSTINNQLGSTDGFIYQAHKKSLEAKRLPKDRAIAELLGAINYLAGAVIWLDDNGV